LATKEVFLAGCEADCDEELKEAYKVARRDEWEGSELAATVGTTVQK
jgi:hypothetical protein